ncbi:hypothetical protein JG491_27975 [Streptomyces sp. CRPSP2-6A1]|nr:hypothetical protein [Streptomyces sp. CRPSP2-6A1]
MERFPCAGGVPIAVVGMRCRFPRANSIGEFWDLLMANSQAVSRIPEDRFDIDDHYAGRTPAPGKTVSRDGGFLDDAFSLDAAFFGISPVEARSMDPQAADPAARRMGGTGAGGDRAVQPGRFPYLRVRGPGDRRVRRIRPP